MKIGLTRMIYDTYLIRDKYKKEESDEEVSEDGKVKQIEIVQMLEK